MTIVFVFSLINEENAAKLLSIFDFGKKGKKIFLYGQKKGIQLLGLLLFK